MPNTEQLGGITIYAQKGYLIGAPTRENWRQEEIFKLESKTLYVGLIPDTMYFNSWGSNYYAVLNGVVLVDNIQSANFAIIKKGAQIMDWQNSTVIKSYSLPLGDAIDLVKRVK
jgi:hypothetical protein